MGDVIYKTSQIFEYVLIEINSERYDTNNITANKNMKVCSFKRSENIRSKEDVSDRSVSNNKFSSVTLNELATKARESIL